MLRHIAIPCGPIDLAANFHQPNARDETEPLRAVALPTPVSRVKEQIGANHASRLATRGIAALALDPAHQGQGGGEPRVLEDPQPSQPGSVSRSRSNAVTLLVILSGGHAVAVHRAWKRVDRRRVVVCSAIQSATRVMLQARAVRTCWTCVLVRPR